MPIAAPKPCSTCGALVHDGTTRCAAHKVKPWAKRAGEPALGGRPWRRVRERVLQRDCGLCQPCARAGRTTLATEVHHLVERSRGGTHNDDNLEAICATCHAELHSPARSTGRGG